VQEDIESSFMLYPDEDIIKEENTEGNLIFCDKHPE
jgi:hypothetical protein